MAKAHIVRLVRHIALTLETELDCGECSHHTASYVEALLAGQDGVDRWSGIKAHLEQCTTCSEEVDHLCKLARMDQDGNWPTLSHLLAQAAETGINV